MNRVGAPGYHLWYSIYMYQSIRQVFAPIAEKNLRGTRKRYLFRRITCCVEDERDGRVTTNNIYSSTTCIDRGGTPLTCEGHGVSSSSLSISSYAYHEHPRNQQTIRSPHNETPPPPPHDTSIGFSPPGPPCSTAAAVHAKALLFPNPNRVIVALYMYYSHPQVQHTIPPKKHQSMDLCSQT